MGRKHQDLAGQRFGHLVVLGRTDDHVNPNGDRVIMYRCKCDSVWFEEETCECSNRLDSPSGWNSPLRYGPYGGNINGKLSTI